MTPSTAPPATLGSALARHRLPTRAARTARLIGAAALWAATATHAEAVAIKDYTVFVDPPTGFVFVKLPTAWRFVGRVDDAALKRLPRGVHTSLLKPD